MNQSQNAINAIRVLSIEAITKAKSGHPGIALGAAPIIYTLYTRHMHFSPNNPEWFNRDRFVLSAGHGSIMLYSILHLLGYQISIEDLKQFRQLNSITPGHPEVYHTKGIDATSGPLGQGIAMGVGMSIAEEFLRHKFGKIVDHYTYVLCGDGDLQEGISQEALSFLGHQKLNKMIILYDSNDIQLDGPVLNANSENVKMKYEAMGFKYLIVKDGNDIEAIDQAIIEAKKSSIPTFIEVKTAIGFGSNKVGTSDVHGAPLSIDEVMEVKNKFNWSNEAFVPKEVYDHYAVYAKKGNALADKWENEIKQYPELIKLIQNKYQIKDLKTFNFNEEIATRNASGKILDELGKIIPTLIGGSADLTVSTKVKGLDGNFDALNRLGRNLNYGVREHAMGAIANGITLHGAMRTFTGAFFVFSDYMKPAIRMAAIMGIPTLFMFSHDTIAVGEDGPTHQPVEQIMGLRAMPNLNVFRPADANEMVYAIKYAINDLSKPSTVLSTRQNLLVLENTSEIGLSKGAYIISLEQGKLDGVIIASGSEVSLAIKTQKLLAEKKIFIRVVSMPIMSLFDLQDQEYQNQIIPKNVKTLALEMGSTIGWYKYAKHVYGIDKYGVSGPLKDVLNAYGFTPENIMKVYEELN